ncbi:FAD-dependent monooxygenase [Gymnodinialimonas hymeniacidonis]|uniref:FAD-dependent monooxygenase n=1 Tax=Gymnodinialimonas hymeniacidonis TaxID=3126508 RepID=UPI0034C6610D
MNEFTADVLIVGAGPTGLATAMALSHLGTSFVLIEAKPTTSVHTKATNLMPGTLEQLDIFGLTERMYDTGGIMTRYMMHMYGSNVGPRPMHMEGSPHPNVLFLGQDLIEKNLMASLPNEGADIRFGHRLVSLDQDLDGVTATVSEGEAETQMRFRYVVGCDGPRSVVRRGTACDFEPVRTGKYVWQADAKLSWAGLQTMKQMWLYYYDEGFGAVIHLPGGITKVMVFEEKGRLPNREPTLAEIQDRLRMMTGDQTATLTDPVWLSHGELLTGVAPSLIDGRILLAGDACNPILPNGGQGLNIGIQDGINLAWKLHDVVQRYASPALLQTYDDERRALRLALENVQINTLKYTLPAPKMNRFILRKFGDRLLNRFWPLMARAFSQLGQKYDKSPLTEEGGRRKGIRAGQRAVDADVQLCSDGTELSLLETLCKPRWKIVVFDAGNDVALSELFDDAAYPFADKLVIRSHASVRGPRTHIDLDQLAHKAYGIKTPTVLLIRPDNYVGARFTDDMEKSVKAYFKTWYPDV